MDEQWFIRHIQQSKDKLFRISYTILRNEQDCADALQETLLRAWQSLPRLRQPEYFDTWLVRILINESKRLYNRRRKQQTLLQAPAYTAPPEDTGLHEALNALDEKYRLAIMLHYLEGYTLEETARLLRVPVGTVKSRLYVGRKRLKYRLEEDM